MGKKSIHKILVHLYSAFICFIRVSVPGLFIVCAPGLFRAGTLLGGLTRDGLLAIFGVTLSNSAIPHNRADNRLRAGKTGRLQRDTEKQGFPLPMARLGCRLFCLSASVSGKDTCKAPVSYRFTSLL